MRVNVNGFRSIYATTPLREKGMDMAHFTARGQRQARASAMPGDDRERGTGQQ
ncbi:MAG: hypothetical protein VB140_08025 [Burkholderia sp.]